MTETTESDVGMIPVDAAIILWSDDLDRLCGERITDVHVCRRDDQPPWTRQFQNSRGACSMAWMSGPAHETPVGVFLEMATLAGFAGLDVRRQALREFAKIAGQDWSLNLLRQLPED